MFSPTRYDQMSYNRVGRSGLKLPAISLGMWHNFGAGDDRITDELREKVQGLNAIVGERGQTLAQMALFWNLSFAPVASVLIGASRPKQLVENVAALDNLSFTEEELQQIENVLSAS